MIRNFLLATTAVAGVAAFTATVNAATLTTVYGGGSTLGVNEETRTVDAIKNGFFLNAVGTAGEVLYTADGSGAGQQAFLLQQESVHVAGSTVPNVDYGASDAFLSSSQITCWNSGNCTTDYSKTITAPLTKGGPLVQLPAFGTPVTIAHNSAYAEKTGETLTFNDNDLCGVFSGKYNNWSQITGVTSGQHKSLTQPIKNVIYRSDGSGTTFLLTQHLAKVCTSSNTAAGIKFSATKSFASIFTSAGKALPSWFVGASGSGGVASALASLYVTGSTTLAGNGIAYLTPDYTSVAPKSIPNSTSGATGTWTANANSPFLKILTAKLLNRHDGTSWVPTPAGTQQGLLTPNTAVGDTASTAPSTKTAQQNAAAWIPIVADPLKGYPIVGYTTLDFAQCYATAAVANEVKAWISQLYAAGNQTNLALEGFTYVPQAFSLVITQTFVQNSKKYNLDINDTAVCGTGKTYAGLN